MGWASAALPYRLYLTVPLSCSICVPTTSMKFKVAVRAPVAVGLKVAVIVQSQPALRVDPQLDVFAEVARVNAAQRDAADRQRCAPGRVPHPCRAHQRPGGAFPTSIRHSSSP